MSTDLHPAAVARADEKAQQCAEIAARLDTASALDLIVLGRDGNTRQRRAAIAESVKRYNEGRSIISKGVRE